MEGVAYNCLQPALCAVRSPLAWLGNYEALRRSHLFFHRDRRRHAGQLGGASFGWQLCLGLWLQPAWLWSVFGPCHAGSWNR